MGRGPFWMPIAATLCLLGVGGTAWVRGEQAPVRERLARFVAEYDERLASPPRREAVYGETLEGNAVEDYLAASEAIAALHLRWRTAPDDLSKKRWQLTEQGSPLTAETRLTMQPTLDCALASIRLGVRRASMAGKRGQVAFFELQAVVDDAIDRAFAARDTRRLVELFLDRWVLQVDLWGRPINVPEFRDDWLHALDAESAAWFDAGLRRLDARTPVVACVRASLAFHVRDIADCTPLRQSFGMGVDAWHYGCDWYWRELVFCDRLLANESALEPPALDWTKRRAQFDAFGSVIDADASSFAARIPRMVLDEERFWRSRVTDLRLQRLAVAFVHGLELPRLDDPLGSGPIEVEIHGDEAMFRSQGVDGKKRFERTVRRR